MSAAARRWPWALAFVGSLQLLTLPLSWMTTDKSEMIVMARRMLERGTPTLQEDGSRPVPEAPWIPRRPGEKVRSRFMPGIGLALVPLVAADRALGLWDSRSMGRLVHLQGWLLVLGSLGLAGAAAARLGAGDAGIAVAIAVLGTSWPVWLVSRNGGPEPLVAFLVVAYVVLGELERARRPARLDLTLRATLLLVLPWVHPTGTVLAVALAASEWGLSAGRRGAFWASVAGAAAGGLSVLLLWNGLYHGDWLAGGYWHAGGKGYFGAASPLAGLARIAREIVPEAPVVILLAVCCALGPSARARRALRQPAWVLAALIALFATTSDPEPPRRLSVAAVLFVLPLALGWRALRFPRGAGTLAVATSLAAGLYWFEVVAGSYYEIPGGGGFLPSVFWAELAIEHGWSALWLGPVLALLAALGLSGARLLRLVNEPAGA